MLDVSFLPRPLDALLVVPPVADVRMPSLAAHLLQACARRAGFAVPVLYANVAFAARAGLEANDVLCQIHPHLFGERLFASAAFGLPPLGTDATAIPQRCRVVRRDGAVSRSLSFAEIKGLEPVAAQWIGEIAAAIAGLQVRLVGFTSSYQQISSSVAVANSLKKLRPDIVTAIGGANCRGVMARGVASLGDALDVVVCGDGEEAFVQLLRQVASSRGAPPPRGVITGAPCADLDDLPLPSYDEYFEQVSRFLAGLDMQNLVVPYDCARGCWWGRRRPCAFCGYDTRRVPVRQKSPGRVVTDLNRLAGRYPTNWVTMADPAIPQSYWDTVVPVLARHPPGLSIVWLARAPLAMEHAVAFRRAGVAGVEIGIESFSTRLLGRLAKGTTGADNVAALRSCRIAGLKVFYVLLFGIPGDELAEYEEMLRLMPLLRHLHPPDDMARIRLYRFSPYLEEPAQHGLTHLRPAAAYRNAFPPTAAVEDLAYRWEAEFKSESIDRPTDFASVPAEVEAWRTAWLGPRPAPRLSIQRCSGALGGIGNGTFILTDTRGVYRSEPSLLLTRAQARAALTAREPRDSAPARFALDRGLALILDDTYVPLATAAPSLVAELDS